mgnify:CR=1 FL=1|tara:strand:+ start:6826 stop:8106 length:1281 start_codon:yes stop_codon:yes gene_type:complete
MSEMFFRLGTASDAPDIPLTMDYEGQVSQYLQNRFRKGERLFDHGILDDYEMPVLHSEGIVHEPPRETELPPVGINEFLFPTGMTRFGRGLFLIDKSHIATFVNHCWGINWDGTGKIPTDGNEPRTLATAGLMVTDDLQNRWLFQPLYMLPPIQVDSTDNQLFIVPMVDLRWLVLHDTIDQAETSVNAATTWADLINSINAATPNHVVIDPAISVPAAYLQPDPGYFSTARSVGYVLEHFAASTGNRITLGNTGILHIQSYGDALGYSALPDRAIFGSHNAGPMIPDSVRLSYRKLYDHADNGSWDSAEASITQHSGAERHYVTTYYVEYYSETIDPSSETDLQALANQITLNSAEWSSGPNYAVTLPGGPDNATNLERCGFTDYTLIKVDCSDAIPQLMTTYQSRKPNFYSPINLSQQPGLYRHP